MSIITKGLDCHKLFFDDIIVWGRTNHQHDKRLKALFKRLPDNDFINDKKSTFCVHLVDFFRHTVFSSGVKPLKSNIDEIVKLEAPTSCKRVCFLLGAATFYQRFISYFS